MNNIYYGYYNSSIGLLEIQVEDNKLIALDFVTDTKKDYKKSEYVDIVIEQLGEYFNGKRKKFKLNLKTNGTDFQTKVWSQLINIPYGKTISYKELAQNIGNEKACRAVGNANNKNKIAIVIPCHRVVGSNNKLVGYAGGIDKKKWLIELEKNNNL
ncbi:MAG: methylated-DNA--[protein]-cysteine S-methyltransferase [Paraclostridium sp.]